VAAFVDFDLGSVQPVTGFDWFDRMHQADRVTGFDMIFSNDPSFGTTVATRNYTGNTDFSVTDSFAPINARYVRYDVTSSAGPANANTGLSDIIFYAVPEPGAAALFSLSALALTRRRRA
jgi:F5/8 type C domain